MATRFRLVWFINDHFRDAEAASDLSAVGVFETAASVGVTHLILCFLVPKDDGTLSFSDMTASWINGTIDTAHCLTIARAAGIRLVASIGGSGGHVDYVKLVTVPPATFAANVLAMVTAMPGVTGVDLDFEGLPPQLTTPYENVFVWLADVMVAMRAQMDAAGHTDYEITASPELQYLHTGDRSFHWIETQSPATGIMDAYNIQYYNDAWEGLNNNTYQSIFVHSGGGDWGPDRAVAQLVAQGFPMNKLVVLKMNIMAESIKDRNVEEAWVPQDQMAEWVIEAMEGRNGMVSGWRGGYGVWQGMVKKDHQFGYYEPENEAATLRAFERLSIYANSGIDPGDPNNPGTMCPAGNNDPAYAFPSVGGVPGATQSGTCVADPSREALRYCGADLRWHIACETCPTPSQARGSSSWLPVVDAGHRRRKRPLASHRGAVTTTVIDGHRWRHRWLRFVKNLFS